MIEKLGIGIDVVEIKRFETIPYHSNPRFYKKIFHLSEIKYCLKYKDPAKHFAGKFAIKEAVKKSISDKIDLLDIETLHSNQKPVVKLKDNRKYRFHISVSHEDTIAIAVVISEKIL